MRKVSEKSGIVLFFRRKRPRMLPIRPGRSCCVRFVFGPVQRRGGGATGLRDSGGSTADGRARPYPGPRERVSLLQPGKSGGTGISRSRRFSAGGYGEPPLSGYL